MALDATARESNVRDSVKKFFIDNLPQTKVSFDQGIGVPKIAGNRDDSVDRWVNIDFGDFNPKQVSEHLLRVIPCSVKDNEGFKLTQLRDKVMGILTNSGYRTSIPLYQSSATEAWVQVGSMAITFPIPESGSLTASSEVKFKIITVLLKWGAKYEKP